MLSIFHVIISDFFVAGITENVAGQVDLILMRNPENTDDDNY